MTRKVTKSALSQARKKLQPSALAAIGAQWVRQWLAAVGEHRWNGLRVVAADGTCVRVPRWRETQDAYGLGPNGDGSVVMARVVGLLAVDSSQMLHAEVGSYADGERSLLVRALGALSVGDLLVRDRGYPAWWLFALFGQRGVPFCARLDSCSCGSAKVRQFVRSGAAEQVIEVHLKSPDLAKLRKAAGQAQAPTVLRLRLVRVVLSTGNIEVLVTSLLDTVAYPAAEFAALYHARWRIEEAFKTLKCRLHLEGFTGSCPAPSSRRSTPRSWWPTSPQRFAPKLTRNSKLAKPNITGSIKQLRSSTGQPWPWHGSAAIQNCCTTSSKS
ncbi:MAG: IS4 family transposase [Burkholderiales bacterium]|nr:IS4 family transposase [Burkholderiales bacterium]